VTLTRLTDFVRCHVRVAIKSARVDYISTGRASAKPLSRPLLVTAKLAVRAFRVRSIP